MAAEELDMEGTKLFSCNDVKVFEIVEHVRSLKMTGQLEAAMVLHQGSAILVLNIGSTWVDSQSVKYVLTKQTPSLKAGKGVYVFPLVDGPHAGHGQFGLQFGKSVSEDKHTAFEQLLQQFSAFAENIGEILAAGHDGDIKDDANMQIVNATEKGVSYMQKGTSLMTESISTLSKFSGKGIKWATKKAKAHMKEGDEMEVSDNVKWQAKKIKQAGGMAVTMSASLVTGAVATAQSLTHSVYEQASSSESGKKFEKVMENPKAQSAAKVGVVAANAAWEIYLAMAEAGVQFVEDVADATGEIVEHKYGKDAGDVAKDGLHAVSDGVRALKTVNDAAYTAIAEGVLKKQAEEQVENSAALGDKKGGPPALKNTSSIEADLGGLD